MDTIASDIDQLERYLKSRCTESEKRDIEERLASDADFRDLLDDLEIMQEALQNMDTPISTDTSEAPKKAGRVIKVDFRRKMAAIIGSAAAVVVIAVAVLRPTPALTPRLVAENHYQPPKPSSVMSDEDKNWGLGSEAYRRGDLEAAIAEWTKITNRNAEQNYYLAHAFYQIGDVTEAISHFEEVARGSSALSYNAEWYMGLAHFLNEDVESGRLVMENIVSQTPQNPFSHRATEVLEDLEKIEKTE